MKDWSNYNTSPSYKDLLIYGGKETFKMQLEGIEGRDIFLNDDIDTVKVLIQTNTNPMNEKQYDYKLTCDLELNFKTGDLVKFEDTNEIYLTVTKVRSNDITKSGKIKLCNYLLKWKNSDNKTISTPCIISNKTLYTDGAELKEIPLGDTKISIQLPNNKETYKLTRDFRLIIGRTVYKITNDTEIYTLDGLITLIATETEKSPKDDLEDGIAYNNFTDIEDVPEIDENYEIIIEGEDRIFWYDYDYPYDCKLYHYGELVEPQPELDYSVDIPELVNISRQDNNFIIKPVLSMGDNTKYIKFKVYTNIDGALVEKIKNIKIEGFGG